MKTTDLAKYSRDEIAERTYQRIAYRKLVDLQVAIRDCKRRGYKLGELGELDTQHLVERLVKLAGIEYRSIAENPGYEEAQPPSIESVTDVPILEDVEL